VIKVEVAYATPECQVVVEVLLDAAATIGEAIERSGIVERSPEIDLQRQRVGIFGRLVGLGEPLADGDRVEIYRPLTDDPKRSRRERARKQV
jgi:hypothetical protein